MQKIVDNLRVSAEDLDRGIIRLDPDKTDGRIVEIRVGRKRDEKTGNIDQTSRARPFTSKLPVVREANGYVHDLTPMEARLRNLNYLAPVYLDFTVIEDGIEKEPEKGPHRRPADHGQVARSAPSTRRTWRRSARSATTSTASACMKTGEDPMDPGGYFIIGGTERVLITLEDLAPNRVMVEYNERYGTKLEVAKVFSQKEGHRALTLVEKKRDGMLMVTVPAASGQIPLVALMKALGMENDQEIFEAIVSDAATWTTSSTPTSRRCQDKKLYPPNGIFTTEDAIALPGAQVRHRPGQGVPGEEGRVHHRPLPAAPPGRHQGGPHEEGHLPRKDRQVRAGTVLEKRKEDDKDHYANKRLKLSGDLMEDLFRVAFTNLMKDLKYQLERSYARKKDLRIASAIRPGPADAPSCCTLWPPATGSAEGRA